MPKVIPFPTDKIKKKVQDPQATLAMYMRQMIFLLWADLPSLTTKEMLLVKRIEAVVDKDDSYAEQMMRFTELFLLFTEVVIKKRKAPFNYDKMGLFQAIVLTILKAKAEAYCSEWERQVLLKEKDAAMVAALFRKGFLAWERMWLVAAVPRYSLKMELRYHWRRLTKTRRKDHVR